MNMAMDTESAAGGSPRGSVLNNAHSTIVSGKGVSQYGIHFIYVRLKPVLAGDNHLRVIIVLSQASPKNTKRYTGALLSPPGASNPQQLCETRLAIVAYELEHGLASVGLEAWRGDYDASVFRPMHHVPNLLLLVRGGGAVKTRGRLQLTELLMQTIKHVFNPCSLTSTATPLSPSTMCPPPTGTFMHQYIFTNS